MRERLEGFLEGTVSDITLHYRVGSSFTGRTELFLEGDGRYRLTSDVTEGRAERTYEGEGEDAAAVARAWAGARVWEFEPDGEKRMDDPPCVLGVDGEQIVLRTHQAREHAGFQAAQAPVIELIRRVSGGEVRESGA
jgi:hypothetical protein